MSQDKQFEPTQRRKQRAREKGQTPRSRDLTSAGLLLLATAASAAWFPALSRSLVEATRSTLGALHEAEPTAEGLRRLLLVWLAVYGRAMAPLLLIIVLGAVLLTFLQGGLALSFYPLTPRLDKLNPATSLKRLFSAQGLVDTIKSLLKVTLAALVAWLVLRQRAPQLLALGEMELPAATATAGHVAWELCSKTALAMLVVGAADYLWQRFDYLRSLRMTREEMRQEVRDTEGDPQVRGRRHRARQKLLRDGLSAHATRATVVLTNPTHVAIALRYGPGLPAPTVVARGQGRLAERIKALARRYGIPVREEAPLARALYAACPLGATIPPALYQAIAVILAELYREATRRQQRHGDGSATDRGAEANLRPDAGGRP